MNNMMPIPGKEPVMDTRSDTSQVAKTIAMEGTRDTRVLMGRLNLFTHSHAPSSVPNNWFSKKQSGKADWEATSFWHKAHKVISEGDADKREVVSVNTGYKASKTATTSLAVNQDSESANGGGKKKQKGTYSCHQRK